jgi:hypothetical protein
MSSKWQLYLDVGSDDQCGVAEQVEYSAASAEMAEVARNRR